MSKIVCGSGHRPIYTPAKYDRFSPWKLSKLKQLTDYLENGEFQTVISGGAEGFDQYLAWASLKVGIPLVFYLPFEGFDVKWGNDQRNQLKKFMSQAQHVDYICEPGYAAWKNHKRNESMVRDSTSVIALWNPAKKSGGTFSTITYALNHQKCVTNLWGDKPEPVTKEHLT